MAPLSSTSNQPPAPPGSGPLLPVDFKSITAFAAERAAAATARVAKQAEGWPNGDVLGAAAQAPPRPHPHATPSQVQQRHPSSICKEHEMRAGDSTLAAPPAGAAPQAGGGGPGSQAGPGAGPAGQGGTPGSSALQPVTEAQGPRGTSAPLPSPAACIASAQAAARAVQELRHQGAMGQMQPPQRQQQCQQQPQGRAGEPQAAAQHQAREAANVSVLHLL